MPADDAAKDDQVILQDIYLVDEPLVLVPVFPKHVGAANNGSVSSGDQSPLSPSSAVSSSSAASISPTSTSSSQQGKESMPSWPPLLLEQPLDVKDFHPQHIMPPFYPPPPMSQDTPILSTTKILISEPKDPRLPSILLNRLCPYYRIGVCPYEDTCAYLHPNHASQYLRDPIAHVAPVLPGLAITDKKKMENLRGNSRVASSRLPLLYPYQLCNGKNGKKNASSPKDSNDCKPHKCYSSTCVYVHDVRVFGTVSTRPRIKPTKPQSETFAFTIMRSCL